MSARDAIREITGDLEPATATPRAGFYFVTCRLSGDDEDSGYIVEAADDREAAQKAEDALREEQGEQLPEGVEEWDEDDPNAPRESYINFVIFCGAAAPLIAWHPNGRA